MNVGEYLGTKFLKVDDLKASGPIRVKITDVSEGQFGKPNVTFHDGARLSLNATNCRAVAREYGLETDAWIDQELELYVGETKFNGEPQETISAKPISPRIENKAPPKPEFDNGIDY
jgi:hypothetical protein